MIKYSTLHIKSHSVFTLGFGLLIAVAGLFVYALPGGFDLEENAALSFLFHQRQQVSLPNDVMLVSIDKAASQQLGLPNDPQSWPRDLHANLIDRLTKAGAEVIAFDVFFHEATEREQDARLARAMRQAGNILIFSRLKREVQPLAGDDAYNLERLVLPMATIHQAAAATAPFALPKVSARVSQFWTFHTSAGDLPSLPTAALELYTAQDHGPLLEALAEIAPQQAAALRTSVGGLNRAGRIAQVRTFFKQQSTITQALLDVLKKRPALALNPEINRRLQALLAVYLGPDRRYLNFYGPPRSISTFSYHEVLSATEAQLVSFKDKVVFVGFSEERQPEQKDSFYTVFSQASGLDLSGVEIAATAFANLLERESLRLPGPLAYLAVILIYGLLLAWLSRKFNVRMFVVLSLSTAGLYTVVCLYAFTHAAFWLPLFVPVLMQTPLALFVGILWRHRELHRERGRIRQAFGYYLPDHVVDNLARSSQQMGTHSERMFGVCMASDAAQYTQLAESMSPEDLGAYMNHYYERLFKPVRGHDGIVSDVVGDAMLAIWSAPQPESRLRRQACLAALEVLRAGKEPVPGVNLQTRIGLHAGEIMLGNVGALDHYEYRAVGDIVNTASRIEGLNKQLGTSLLVSQVVLAGLDGFVSRELGVFRMAGKQQAIMIYELLGLQSECGQQVYQLCEHFAEGLYAYQHHDWQTAIRRFQQALEVCPEDGPSRYYLERCSVHTQGALSVPKDGVIVVQKK